jgi:uncharacterized membrane protein YgdD (TMEM256/DUF423 family)
MISRSRSRAFLPLGSVLAGLAVAAGAFGAHFLKSLLEPSMLAVFETAVRYQMYHALGLCVVAWVLDCHPAARVSTAGWCFVVGIALFCGSLYALALSGIRAFGSVTPLGGGALIIGWGLLAWEARPKKEEGSPRPCR